MAAGTRSKEAMEEGSRNTDTRVHELMNSHHTLQKSMEDMGEKVNQVHSTMELMMVRVLLLLLKFLQKILLRLLEQPFLIQILVVMVFLKILDMTFQCLMVRGLKIGLWCCS